MIINPETQREILKYKTPEELATALEGKTKNELAQKIRKISWEVKENSTDWREQLSKELSADEEREIKNALPWDWVEEIFNEWITPEEKAKQILEESTAEIIWEKNVKTLKKVEWIWERFSTWFDKIWNIFSEKWIMAWIWAIILMFKWIFSWNFSALDNILNPKKEEEKWKKKEWAVEWESNIDILDKYHFWIAAFLKIQSWKDSQEYLILNSPKIKTKTYNWLWIDNLQENWLSDKLWFTNINDKKLNDKNIYQSLLLIKQKEKIIDTILVKKEPDWKNKLTLQQVIEWIYKEIKFYWSFENINLNNFDLSEFNVWFLNFKNTEKWDLNDKLNTLQKPGGTLNWVSINFLSKLYLDDSYNKDPNYSELIKWLYWTTSANEKEKIFLDNFIKFWNDFIWLIKNNFYLWPDENKKEFWEFFDKWISTKTILEFYIITWWNIDIGNYTDIQRSMIYLKIFKLLWNNTWLRWKTYDKEIITLVKSWFEKWSEMIPQSFKDILQKIMLNTFNEISKYIKNSLVEVYNALSWQTLILLLISSWILIYLLSKLKLIKATWWGIVIWVLLSQIVKITNYWTPKNNAEKIFNTLKKENPEKFNELVKKYWNENKFKKQLTEDFENPIREWLTDKIS